jgi:biopolymer transport protein ExbD
MVDSAGPKKKAGPGARKKRRVALRIDMTPMVDIAFLLVIFFMTTTRFREPQAIEITLPKPGKPKKTKQSNVLVIAIDNLGKMTYKISGAEPLPVDLDSLEPLLNALEQENILKQSNGAEYLDKIARTPPGKEHDALEKIIKEDISKLTVLIQVDPRSRYKSVIEAMDAVNHAKMARFSVVRAGALDQPAAAPGAPAPPPAPTAPTGMNLPRGEYFSTRRA